MIAKDSSLSHWCHEGENSLADYHRIRSAQDVQKESLEYLKWMVLIEHDENGNRKLVRCNVTDDGQITFKDINLGGRQRGRRRCDAVLFNSDTLSKIISYIPSIDVLNLALTCKGFGIHQEAESFIKKSAHILVQEIATEEQLAALPQYEGESSLADYHYLQLMRSPLTFDQLIGAAEYVNKEDKSWVRQSGKGFEIGTAFSNNILRAGKHYVSFTPSCRSSDGIINLIVGVMRPGQTNQQARGTPLNLEFYQNFSQRMGHGRYSNNIHCCFYNSYAGNCYTKDWEDLNGATPTNEIWDGSQSSASGDEVGMLLDLDEGTLTVYKNGQKLGVMKRGLAGPYCWVASMFHRGEHVTIKRGMIPS